MFVRSWKPNKNQRSIKNWKQQTGTLPLQPALYFREAWTQDSGMKWRVCSTMKKTLNGNVHVQQDWARSRHVFELNISQRASELYRVQLVSLQLTKSLHLEMYFRKASGHTEKVVALHKFRKDKVYCRSWFGRYQPRALRADRLRPHMHTVVWVTGRDTLGNRSTTNINKIYSGTL